MELPLYCTKCGMSIFPGWNYCAFCSTALPEEQIEQRLVSTRTEEPELHCPECAAPIGVSWTACSSCGIRIEVEETTDGHYRVWKLVRAEVHGNRSKAARQAAPPTKSKRPVPKRSATARGSQRKG